MGTITTKTPQQSVSSNCYIEGRGVTPKMGGGSNGSGQLLNSQPGRGGYSLCARGQARGCRRRITDFLSSDNNEDNFQSYAMHFEKYFRTVNFPPLYPEIKTTNCSFELLAFLVFVNTALCCNRDDVSLRHINR